MKNLFTLLVFYLFCVNASHTQSCFELIIEPTITSTSPNGELLTCEFRISINNLTFSPELELHTQQNAIGISDSVTSFINFTGVSKNMQGGQIVSDSIALNPAVNYLGQDYSSYLIYGHTVANADTSLPQIIPIGDTQELCKLTLNFDGTQKFTDDPALATSGMPYLLDTRYFNLFPGQDSGPFTGVLNTFGTILPNGFPRGLNCYSSSGSTCAFEDDPCDDNDPTTLYDKFDASCNCVGIPINVIQQTCNAIQAEDDDIEQSGLDQSMDLNSAEIAIVNDGNSDQLIGLRFLNVVVPQGASIISAHIQFTAGSASLDPADFIIQGELNPDASGFSSISDDAGSRIKTDSTVMWSPAEWTSPGERDMDQNSPNLKGVIQQIVDQGAYTSGNAIALFISGTGTRNAISFDADVTNAAEICIEYKVCPTDLILDSSLNTVGGTFDANNSITLQGPLAVDNGQTLILNAPNIIVKDNVDASMGDIQITKTGCQ